MDARSDQSTLAFVSGRAVVGFSFEGALPSNASPTFHRLGLWFPAMHPPLVLCLDKVL